jgi:hypothetical protein
MKHKKMAEDVWRMISALGDVSTDEDFQAAAVRLIEMACDSAAEAQRIADGYPPLGL